MNDKAFLKFSEDNDLLPVAWFGINYPTYAVKVKYKYPTSDPADFRDRALLQLIDLGIPYSTACALLLVNDPHKSILQRFKSDNPGPQLVKYDLIRKCNTLTPLGKQRVERIELARDGVACCFIDGFTGTPFPSDVVENLMDRYDCIDVKFIPGGIYPFEAGIENKITEINAKLNEGKGKAYRKRMRLPEKATETSITPLGAKWMKNISIGIFLKNGIVIRRIFCDKMNTIEPFGWLMHLDSIKLTVSTKNNAFAYCVSEPNTQNVFALDNRQLTSQHLMNIIQKRIEKDYGMEFANQYEFTTDINSGLCTLHIKTLERTSGKRARLLSSIEQGILPVRLPGLTGSLFLRVTAAESIHKLSSLRKDIDKSEKDWHDVINSIKKREPYTWRQTLIDIDRHDLLFRYDIEHFIHYGK